MDTKDLVEHLNGRDIYGVGLLSHELKLLSAAVSGMIDYIDNNKDLNTELVVRDLRHQLQDLDEYCNGRKSLNRKLPTLEEK